ncbi:7-carboxy-7-deazaguanine synthase QueE [Amycolatopsis sp. H20-H5]|uniref:7-carboxy-7-deazaguanine synthase QueE n=1 Tax=Amycolatopsis sp. H20-H5 TaxID=3046309 RepID=UPI002DB56BE9|nr:7-carboxy-7-deazaguanine synthase QueE [Amycolatopsis sp. H20-H5]MEC3978916.1 7-carboxy-7-deazaguanine synthase QueE [Amycolatopsis sp. H20-H5]
MTITVADDELLVAERFGPTVQGEGPSTGRRAVFIRLMNCNLTCKDCDTPYTWDGSRFDLRAEVTVTPIEDLLAWATVQPVDLVVITGGEPLMQQRRLIPLARGLVEAGLQVEVETNGTITPTADLLAWVTRFNVSPKLSSFGAGMPRAKRIKAGVLNHFAVSGRAVFKFVVTSPADLVDISDLVADHHLDPVYVMPEGRTAAEVVQRLADIADPAIARGFHLSTRLHVLTWGDQRGR